MKKEILDIILTSRSKKQTLAVITRVADGMQWAVLENDSENHEVFNPLEIDTIKTSMRDNKSSLISDEKFFVHIYTPPLRLIIIGAVHIAQFLAPMAKVAGFDVTVVDPRSSFATPSRFPEINLSDEWPDDGILKLKPDTRTAVVTLTHDPKLDDPALVETLKTPAFYIASLGGTRTHGKRLERLKSEGFDEKELLRINGPAGLDIGSVAPSEIAISILAELTAALHGRLIKSKNVSA
jgi:xanthine dehydrogenase accessory factor